MTDLALVGGSGGSVSALAALAGGFLRSSSRLAASGSGATAASIMPLLPVVPVDSAAPDSVQAQPFRGFSSPSSSTIRKRVGFGALTTMTHSLVVPPSSFFTLVPGSTTASPAARWFGVRLPAFSPLLAASFQMVL